MFLWWKWRAFEMCTWPLVLVLFRHRGSRTTRKKWSGWNQRSGTLKLSGMPCRKVAGSEWRWSLRGTRYYFSGIACETSSRSECTETVDSFRGPSALQTFATLRALLVIMLFIVEWQSCLYWQASVYCSLSLLKLVIKRLKLTRTVVIWRVLRCWLYKMPRFDSGSVFSSPCPPVKSPRLTRDRNELKVAPCCVARLVSVAKLRSLHSKHCWKLFSYLCHNFNQCFLVTYLHFYKQFVLIRPIVCSSLYAREIL